MVYCLDAPVNQHSYRSNKTKKTGHAPLLSKKDTKHVEYSRIALLGKNAPTEKQRYPHHASASVDNDQWLTDQESKTKIKALSESHYFHATFPGYLMGSYTVTSGAPTALCQPSKILNDTQCI
jgi:hypothetical protein